MLVFVDLLRCMSNLRLCMVYFLFFFGSKSPKECAPSPVYLKPRKGSALGVRKPDLARDHRALLLFPQKISQQKKNIEHPCSEPKSKHLCVSPIEKGYVVFTIELLLISYIIFLQQFMKKAMFSQIPTHKAHDLCSA